MNVFRSGPSLVVARRGSAREAIENTVEAFDLAEAEGADALHLDVRLTADGEVVVAADPEVVVGNQRVAVAALCVPDLLRAELLKGDRRYTLPAFSPASDTIAKKFILDKRDTVTYLPPQPSGPVRASGDWWVLTGSCD